MKSLGQLTDRRNIAGTILMPQDIRMFRNTVDFYIVSGSGEPHGFSNAEYENMGAIIVASNAEAIRLSDIVIVHDEPLLHREISNTSGKKIFLTDIDFRDSFFKLIPILDLPISLFSFHQLGGKASDWESFRFLYLSFLKYALGEPIDYALINAISSGKILENGRIVNQQILNIIESI